MNTSLANALISCETDITGVMKRFADNEELYLTCLTAFLEDPTMEQLEEAVAQRDWDGAFTAAHALKGLAGNMGFLPLFHATAELVVVIRAGRISDMDESICKLRRCYTAIVNAIQENCA